MPFRVLNNSVDQLSSNAVQASIFAGSQPHGLFTFSGAANWDWTGNTGATILLNTTIKASRMSIATGSTGIYVNEAGIYAMEALMSSTGAETGARLAFAINGTVAGPEFLHQIPGRHIATLAAGDIISLVKRAASATSIILPTLGGAVPAVNLSIRKL
jgi:hypothetical protein